MMMLMGPWLVLVAAIVAAVAWAWQRSDPSGAPSRRWGGPVAVLAAATAIVVLLGWMGMPGWGGNAWMGGHMGRGTSASSTSEATEGARQVDVEAGELWFDPATLEVTAGEPVNLRLVNTGEVFHDLTIPAADVVLTTEPDEEAIGAIEFAEGGRYEFFCSVPGHAQGGMRGTIVATDAS